MLKLYSKNKNLSLTGSHADIAGLKSGDYIVRINGQNISRSTANSVAKIVRYDHQVALLC